MWNKNKILVILSTCLLLFGFINIINIPQVFAVTLVTSCNSSQTSGASVNCTINETSGDLLIVATANYMQSSSCPPAVSNGFPKESAGSTTFSSLYDSGCQQQVSNGGMHIYYYTGIAAQSGNEQVQMSWASSTTGQMLMMVFEVTGATNALVGSATGSGTTSGASNSYSTSTSVSFGAAFLVSISEVVQNTNTVFAPGSGYTQQCGSGGCYVGIQLQYSTSASSPTNFPWSISSNGINEPWFEAGVAIGSASTVTQPISICTQEIGTVPLGITIPLYDPPGFNSDWTTIENDATSNPSIKFTVIVNVANGAGSAQSPTFTTGINAMLAAGVRVIGYEYTTYSHRSSALVQTDIQHWTSFYPQINGIFFDQVGSTAGNASYYQALVAFASSQHYTSFYSSGNPGIAVSSSLYGIFTNLNIWEKPGTPSTTVLASSTTNPPSAFSFISNGIATGADTNSTYLNSVTPYVGNVFITSSNAYTALPSYFSTLVSNVALTASGVPSGTFTITGGSPSPSPSTLTSNTIGSCVFTNVTVQPSTTITITAPAAATYTRFIMNSTSASQTTATISSCASGTCTGKQIDVYYQISNSYGVQAVNPNKFNGNTAIVITGFFGGKATNVNIPITLGSNLGTIGYTFFDYGTISFPLFFTVNALQWAASPQSSASVLNTNAGGGQLIVGYIGGNQSTSSGTITRTVIVSLVTTVTIGTTTCGNINDCSADQFGSFLSFLLPALIIIGMFEYLLFAMGVRDERAFVLLFMIIVSGICYASSLQAFGNFGIPWYIGIFVDIVGFMLIITYNRDRGITSSE